MKVTQLDHNSKRIREKSKALSTTTTPVWTTTPKCRQDGRCGPDCEMCYDSNCTTSLNPSDETKHICCTCSKCMNISVVLSKSTGVLHPCCYIQC